MWPFLANHPSHHYDVNIPCAYMPIRLRMSFGKHDRAHRLPPGSNVLISIHN